MHKSLEEEEKNFLHKASRCEQGVESVQRDDGGWKIWRGEEEEERIKAVFNLELLI